ncbi:MAG TPA: hypothetical protein VFS20_32055 [Longimicrobium sp.]|nr:hypothetical protein [Longimicrobium sp.]
MYKVDLRSEGDELVAIFPSEMLKRLGVGEGDTLFLVERDGEFFLTTSNPREMRPLDRQQEGVRKAYEQLAERYGSTLRDLAQ